MSLAHRTHSLTPALRLCMALLLGCAAYGVRAEPQPTVAAASDLRFALEALAARFTADSGRQLALTFGSSGQLRQQITQGAPFELYLSADEGYVFELARAGLTVDDGAAYAVGRIALFVPSGSPLVADATLADLRAALGDGRLQKFAIANPAHAPYGRAARQALEHAGLWQMLQPHLVLGENVAQAAQFAASGSAQAGIVAYPLLRSTTLASQGTHVLLPAEWHAPLRQRMVLLKSAGDTARAFYAYLQTPPARALLREYGFGLPGE